MSRNGLPVGSRVKWTDLCHRAYDGRGCNRGRSCAFWHVDPAHVNWEYSPSMPSSSNAVVWGCVSARIYERGDRSRSRDPVPASAVTPMLQHLPSRQVPSNEPEGEPENLGWSEDTAPASSSSIPRSPRIGVDGWQAPSSWMLGDITKIVEIAYLAAESLHKDLPEHIAMAWRRVDAAVELCRTRAYGVPRARAVNIWCVRRDERVRFEEAIGSGRYATLDVVERGVDCTPPNWHGDWRTCTGMDEHIIAAAMTVKATAEVILDAVMVVEGMEVNNIIFVCPGATHRSVACAVILHTNVYPRSNLRLTTSRTSREALTRHHFTQVEEQARS